VSKRRRTSAEYLTTSYLSKRRLSAYWHQVDEVARLAPNTVLCIGPGNGFVPNWLEDLGVRTYCLEIISSALADVRGDVRRLPLRDSTVDVVLCAQVLEHVPLADLEPSLVELRRVTRRAAVVTLPRSRRRVSIRLEVPRFGHRQLSVELPTRFAGPMVEPSEHHWEIDQPSAPLASVIDRMRNAGWEPTTTYRVPELPYHQVFVLTAS
jgi:hypothetical protein